MSIGTWKNKYDKSRDQLHLPEVDDAMDKLFDRLHAYQFSDHQILLIAQAIENSRVKVVSRKFYTVEVT